MKPVSLLKPGRKLEFGERVYVIEEFIAKGGSGEVYRAKSEGRQFAAKVFFPFYQLNLFTGATSVLTSSINELLEFQKKEYEFLSRLSHPNIVKVYDAAEFALTQTEQKLVPIKGITSLPALVMDFVDGRPIKEAIEEFQLNADDLAQVLLRFAKSLEYLHAERHYMHVDIKSANILIRKLDHEPILIDFALCKNLNFSEVSADERTKLLGDWDLFPKGLPTDHRLKMLKQQDGTRRELEELGFPTLDLFQVGKLLSVLRPKFADVFDDRDIAYLEALASQLTQWDVVCKWGPRDLAPRIARIGPHHFAAFGIPELTTASEKTIVVPPGVMVPFTKRVEQILNTRSFRRLATIQQLSLLNLVYPGADYKRWVHVLLAYDLARQMVMHLYGSPLFRVLFDSRAVQQLLAVTLLHDINHFPFLHIFQESTIPNLNKEKVIDTFCNGEATGEKRAGRPSVFDLIADIGIEPDRFKRLLFSKHHEQSGSSIEIDQVISSIVNSGVDVDKLSYLQLDSHFTGVRYGAGIDFPAILQAVTVGQIGAKNALHIGFGDRAIQALENVVMTRFWNFRSIYWHHTNRAIMAMLLHVVRRLYVEKKREVREYLLETMWSGDVEAVRFLDRQYQMEFGQPSILNGIIEDRQRLYKRIYTVRAGVGDDSDDALYSDCRKLDYEREVLFRQEIANGLSELLPPDLRARPISIDDVLVDIPRREMDSGGSVYVTTMGTKLQNLAGISDPIRSISANYERLTKRVRFFVSPLLSPAFDRSTREEKREPLKRILKAAMDVTMGRSEVQ